MNKGVFFTLKDINLLNARVAIVNYGVLNLTNVKGNSVIENYGVIVSGVIFYVIGFNKTTYDSFGAVLKTVDGIPIETSILIFNDDQGHIYQSYICHNGIYINYVPVGVIGHVTFNNTKINGYPSLVSSGSLNITEYPKKTVSAMNFAKNTQSKIMKNVLGCSSTKIVKSVVKNVNHFVKNTVNNLFKYFLRA